jgi:hypothetical protein
MTSTRKIAFNMNNLIIHSTLNILVQQSLFNILNLSSDSLNRFTCRYEQLQLVGARMFNVINNKLRSIKHVENNFFGVVDVIMIGDYY